MTDYDTRRVTEKPFPVFAMPPEALLEFVTHLRCSRGLSWVSQGITYPKSNKEKTQTAEDRHRPSTLTSDKAWLEVCLPGLGWIHVEVKT